jgi:hypothetical protein
MITDGKVVHSVAELFDNASGFMAKRHWHRARAITVDHRQVRMAEPGRFDADKNFANTRRLEIELFDFQRPRLRIWMRGAHCFENCGADFHRRN